MSFKEEFIKLNQYSNGARCGLINNLKIF